MFPPDRAPRVYEHIMAQIERAIYDGHLQHGDKLPPERQLALQARASRVAVREALRALEHRGLVEVRQGASGGYFVRAIDAHALRRDLEMLVRAGRVSIRDLAEVRAVIEPQVAALAAARATDVDVKALTASVEERADSAAPGTPLGATPSRSETGAPPLAVDFHRLVADTAKNPVLTLLVHALVDLHTDTADAGGEADVVHREIRDAIATHQPARARAAMESHLADVQRRLTRAASTLDLKVS
jgi:GntR family transcriptional repressor for pyruvate dehydrogenase complex